MRLGAGTPLLDDYATLGWSKFSSVRVLSACPLRSRLVPYIGFFDLGGVLRGYPHGGGVGERSVSGSRASLVHITIRPLHSKVLL
jgi:hypothetical protein